MRCFSKYLSRWITIGDKVTIEAKVIGDISGTKIVSIWHDYPTSSNGKSKRLHFENEKGTWVGEYKIKSSDEIKEWKFFRIELVDKVGNYKSIEKGYIVNSSQCNFSVIDKKHENRNKVITFYPYRNIT